MRIIYTYLKQIGSKVQGTAVCISTFDFFHTDVSIFASQVKETAVCIAAVCIATFDWASVLSLSEVEAHVQPWDFRGECSFAALKEPACAIAEVCFPLTPHQRGLISIVINKKTSNTWKFNTQETAIWPSATEGNVHACSVQWRIFRGSFLNRSWCFPAVKTTCILPVTNSSTKSGVKQSSEAKTKDDSLYMMSHIWLGYWHNWCMGDKRMRRLWECVLFKSWIVMIHDWFMINMFIQNKLENELQNLSTTFNFQLFAGKRVVVPLTICCHVYEGNHCESGTRGGSLGSQSRAVLEILMSHSSPLPKTLW